MGKIDGLVVAPDQVITDNRYPLKAGENLKRGRVLTLDTTTNKLVGANTGDAPHSILVADTDATAGDTECTYYVKGSFDSTFMDFGTGSEAEFREAFRQVGIYTFEPNK